MGWEYDEEGRACRFRIEDVRLAGIVRRLGASMLFGPALVAFGFPKSKDECGGNGSCQTTSLALSCWMSFARLQYGVPRIREP